MTDNDLLEAHRKISEVAFGLQKRYGPIDAAGVLIGGAAGVLEVAYGPELVAQYLHELADELCDPTVKDEASKLLH